MLISSSRPPIMCIANPQPNIFKEDLLVGSGPPSKECKECENLHPTSPPTSPSPLFTIGFMAAAAAAAKYKHFDVSVVEGGVAIITYDRADNKV